MVLSNFIVFEGIDGAGTSTQLKILKARKESEKISFSTEPTKKETGIFLRRILSGEVKVDAKTAAFLFAADRAEHVWGKNGIEETVKSGKVVLTDRYLFSSLAYQSVDCGETLPSELNKHFPLPEILFFFNIEPKASLERIKGRGFTEIYENREFLDKTALLYRKVIESFKNQNTGMKIIELDGNQSKEKIAEIIWSNISSLPIFKE